MSLANGGLVQNAIHLAGGSQWPISPEDWEAKARVALDDGPFDYVSGGAGGEATMRANLEAFARRRLRPRMLTGNDRADGIVVSNYGGRQVDGAVAALDALVEVRGAVGREAVGLAAGRQAGVEAVVRHLAAEIDLTLALVGCRSARELDASFVA